MNIKSELYKLITSLDSKNEQESIIASASFQTICVYYAYISQLQQNESHKNDLSWLLWVIFQKHAKARTEAIISTLLACGADPNYRAVSVCNTVIEMMKKTPCPFSQNEVTLLKNLLLNMSSPSQNLEISFPVCRIEDGSKVQMEALNFGAQTQPKLLLKKINNKLALEISN